MHTNISKTPRCRWCDREPEFSPTVATTRVCEHCGAMQDPIISLSGPAGGKPRISFFINPDDGLFVEFEKSVGDETVRYTLSPALLQKAGVPVFKAPFPLNGKAVDRGL